MVCVTETVRLSVLRHCLSGLKLHHRIYWKVVAFQSTSCFGTKEKFTTIHLQAHIHTRTYIYALCNKYRLNGKVV